MISAVEAWSMESMAFVVGQAQAAGQDLGEEIHHRADARGPPRFVACLVQRHVVPPRLGNFQPDTPKRRIDTRVLTVLFGSIGFGLRKGHKLIET